MAALALVSWATRRMAPVVAHVMVRPRQVLYGDEGWQARFVV